MNDLRPLLCLLVALALPSCAVQPTAQAPLQDNDAAAAQDPPTNAAPRRDGVKHPLSNTEHGLRLRQWRIAERPDIPEVLMRHADAWSLDEPLLRTFEHNGLRLLRVPAENIENLLADLGGASRDVEGWHGQAYDWRDVVTRAVDPDGVAVAVDGRVRRFAGGYMRLLIRAWTLQMEHGPRLCLQIIPDYDRTASSPLDQALGRKGFAGEPFASLWVELLLERGFAYLLTCDAPGLKWDGELAEGGNAAELDPVTATVPTERGDPGGVGPEAPPPLTVGQMLLRVDSEPPSREILLFLPRIPSILYPPQDSDSGVDRIEEIEP